MNAVLTINGVDYDGPARAAASIEMPSLVLDFEGYDEFEFSEVGCGPAATFQEGHLLALAIDGTTVYRGEVIRVGRKFEKTGWVFVYRCRDLKQRADSLSIRNRTGTGSASFNESPDDPSYTATLAGLTVGQIVTKVLTAPPTAQALNALGIGNFSGLPTVPALPAQTVSDLAALDVVPHKPVILSGGIWSNLQQFVREWCPRFMLTIRADDGTVRAFDLFNMPVRTVTIPGDSGDSDPVELTELDTDSSTAYAAVQAVGSDVDVATLSTKDGTLTPLQGTGAAWTTAQEAAWRYSDFQAPRDAYDQGTLSNVTLNTCTVKSDDLTRNWPANFWNGRGGQITLIWDAGGAESYQTKRITSCTAMTAGGTATITWDSADPASTTSFNRYRISADFAPLALVGRSFLVRDKTTGQTGLNAPVGAALVDGLFPKSFSLPVGGILQNYLTAIGIVFWSIDGSATPFNSISVPIRVDPENGRIIATYPIVQATASQAQLSRGYPTTFQQGKPVDFLAIVAYSKGGLVARYPETGFAGKAHERNGNTQVLTIPADEWIYNGDRAKYLKMATEMHRVYCDPVATGSLLWHDYPTAFNPAVLGYSFELALGGASPSPWAGINLPVRGVRVSWPASGPDVVTVAFSMSNLRRPAQGADGSIDQRYVADGFNRGDWGPAYSAGGLGGMLEFATMMPIQGPGSGVLASNGPSGMGDTGDWGDGSEFGPQWTGDWGSNPVEPIGDWGNDTFGGFGSTVANDGGAARWDQKARDRKAERERREVDISPDPNRDPFEPTRPEIIPPPPVPLSDRRKRRQPSEED